METTVLLVDDHPLFRKGIRVLLEGEGDMRVAGEAGDGQEAIALVRELVPDVVIMDINMPKLGGVEATRQILAESPRAKIIALSIHGEKQFIEQMLEAGAAGYLLKDSIPEELVNGIRAVMRGEVVLSAEVAGLVVAEYRKSLSGAADNRAMVSPIIHTKLHRPPQPPDLVSRPHLLARLDESLPLPLILVSAAAGFGKTTLLAAWLETCDCPSAWLGLDEDASDPVVFLNYLVAAIQTLYPDACDELLNQLRSGTLPPPVLVSSLLNELAQVEESTILVLDDYHKVQDTAVHDLLATLLLNLPTQIHLVIASRTDPPFPLTSLRARGRVLELRTDDLRFAPEETRAFVEGMVGRNLGRETTDLLDTKTEGWIVGLRLAALSMRGLSDAKLSTFVQRFKGTSSAYVADYLVDEVLAGQSPEVQEFLLRTSILDRFCAGLCEAVLGSEPGKKDDALRTMDDGPQATGARWSAVGRPSSQSEAMLEELKRSNLFLVPLDQEGIWYRYHHLFQDLLRHRLESLTGAAQLVALHARASAWFVKQGLVDEALDHALSAGDVDSAAEIVEQSRGVVLMDDQWFNLARWLDRLPAEVKWERTDLLLAQAWVLWDRLDLAVFPSVLEALEDAVDRNGASDPVQGELDFFRGYLSYFQALGPEAEEYHASATQKLPETYHTARWEAELHFALARHMNGRGAMAIDRLTDLLQSQRVTRGISRSRLWAGMVFIHLLDGDLQEVIPPVQKMQEIGAEEKNQHVETWGLYLETSVHFRWNDLEHAAQEFEKLAGQINAMDSMVAADCFCALSLAYQHLQRPDEADAAVEALLVSISQTDDPLYKLIASSLQARLSLLRGDTAAAVQWLRTANLAASAGVMLWWLEVPRLTECRVLIAEGSDTSLQEAVDKLTHYDRENEAVHNACQRATILPLLALATHKQGQTDQSLAILGRAVALVEPGGFIRPFVDLGSDMAALLQEFVARSIAEDSLGPTTARFLHQVLAAFPEPVESPVSAAVPPAPRKAVGMVEQLTEREMEVLVLLAQRPTNQEIARELVITVGTVKQHTNSIYGKLGVGDRREAVERARLLGLLPTLPA